jgi:hypothetical protein
MYDKVIKEGFTLRVGCERWISGKIVVGRTPCLRFHSVFRFRKASSHSFRCSNVGGFLLGTSREDLDPACEIDVEYSRVYGLAARKCMRGCRDEMIQTRLGSTHTVTWKSSATTFATIQASILTQRYSITNESDHRDVKKNTVTDVQAPSNEC